MVPHCLIIRDHILCAFRLDQLVVTPASGPLTLLHFPLFEAAQGDVFSDEHIESGVDVLQCVITNEHDGVKPLQNHADLRRCIPTIVASRGEIRGVESMSTPRTHRIE